MRALRALRGPPRGSARRAQIFLAVAESAVAGFFVSNIGVAARRSGTTAAPSRAATALNNNNNNNNNAYERDVQRINRRAAAAAHSIVQSP